MIVYEHTRDFDRHGCVIGARQVDYAYLEQWYVCRECGGSPMHRTTRVDGTTVDWAECVVCGTRDFISQRLYDRQCQDYDEIVEKLPPELLALLPVPEPAASVWSDEELEAFNSILPDWLSATKREDTARKESEGLSTLGYRPKTKSPAQKAIEELYDL